MADPELALHKALLAALAAAVTVPVYDAVPYGAAKPYVTVDTSIFGNADALLERRDDGFVFLNVWSEALGQQEVKRIMGEINAINDQKLTLDTGTVISLRVERKTTQRDADNRTFMGRVTLHIRTHH
jgi:hypothetical protein